MGEPTIWQLREDVAYLIRRARRAGAFSCDSKRDYGASSNALVDYAYGGTFDRFPSDRSDYAACVRAVRGLPRHRQTPSVMAALRQAKQAYLDRRNG